MTIEWELLRSAAISLSAVIAAVTFVASTISARAEQRAKDIRDWQRVVIAEIFQNNPETRFSFADLFDKYRSASVEYGNHKLKPNDLSKASLRRIILDLVSQRVVDQFPEDRYGLNSLDIELRDQKFIAQWWQFMQDAMGQSKTDANLRSIDASDNSGKVSSPANVFQTGG